MKNIIPIALLFILLNACRPTAMVTLNVLEPAPVSMPAYVKTIGIVNRSMTTGANRVTDAVDKIFTLEGANLDKEGAQASIRGLRTELSKDKRFTEIKFLDNTNLSTVTPQLFPAPLSWDDVERICHENHCDALFALELFDTDSKVSYDAIPVKVNSPLGKLPMLNQQATMLTNVKTGWRIYDPVGKNILDEFAISRRIRYTGGGLNPVAAANALIGRKEAVKEVGNRAGQGYAYRIVPYWLTVGREYYRKGGESFKMASRKAVTGNWQQAGEIWQNAAKSGKRKTAARACYNLALVSEVNGDLDQAMQWAQRSYEDYNNKYALHYMHILENRKLNLNRLDDQEAEDISRNSKP